LESGYQSYMLLPIIHEEEFLGFMEIGSPNKFELHKGMLKVMGEILPVISMAHKRFSTEVQNQIEVVIQ